MKNAKILTIAEIKGGTGKTTTAATIAQAAKFDGKRVLIIDLDGQATISHRFGADTERAGAFDLLENNAPISETIQETAQGVDIIAGAPDLYEIKFKKGGIITLEERIKPILKKYDLIVIDTPPALNDLTFNAMQAASGLIIAMVADEGSADGLLLTLSYANEIKRTNNKLKVLGCIITQYDPRPTISKQFHGLIEEVAKANKCPILADIRRGVAIQEAAAYGKNLFEYAPKSKPAQDYKELYNKIIK